MIRNELVFSPAIVPALPRTAAEKPLFFDIETTGLSAGASYVYLIGVAYAEQDHYRLLQWMTTDPSEEKELLRTFFEFASGYSVLVHYNGSSFDLPFLEKKSKRHCLPSPLSSMESIDLYRTAQRLKGFLSVNNLKLKTMEQLFGLSRTDTFSGGELIEVYAHFLGLFRLNEITHGTKQAEITALEQVLLLHNAEDVENLPSLSVLLELAECFRFFTEQTNCHRENHFLVFSVPVPFSLPKTVTLRLPFETALLQLDFPAGAHTAELCLPLRHDELKHFYSNYNDYYYLPAEDCAMHKSVAMFVEKNFRKKATAATCYTRKEGDFLPLRLLPAGEKNKAGMEEFSSLSCFQTDYRCNYQYTPLCEELLSDSAGRSSLCYTLLKSILFA